MSFIEESLQQISSKHKNVSDLIFILPSQRACGFLKSHLAHTSQKPEFLPEVYSIESFIKEVSGLEIIDSANALFKIYEVYSEITEDYLKEDFDTFSGWAQTILQDFNEIDRYLIPASSFFDYLSNIKDTEHWYLADKKSEFIETYLAFWRQLPKLYKAFIEALLKDNKAYQGLAYRIAYQNIESYCNHTEKTHIFLGFNALNTAEQSIIKHLQENTKAEVYWDLDNVLYNDNYHEASYFIRQYFKTWKHLEKENFKGSESYSKNKHIQITGTPKKIGQAKVIGGMLSKMTREQISETVIVLGDETLLLPVLNAIPETVRNINITMGLPLYKIPLASLVELIFQVQLRSSGNIYYKTILDILNHPSIQQNIRASKRKILDYIYSGNLALLKPADIIAVASIKEKETLKLIFESSNNRPKEFMENLQDIILLIKNELDDKDAILREYLYRFNVLFNKLNQLLKTYSHITSINTLYSIYKDLLSSETLDFIGKKHDGLQVMGVLETRVLDFKNVIIASVNEGILPSGKSNNSYLPYDLKKEYGLPTYKEKDAVYSYHFYHLLQRAKQVTIIYNTEPGDLNSGEKSHFITQLEIEQNNFPNHNYTHDIRVPKVPKIEAELRDVKKTAIVMDKIKKRAVSGFSPSALTLYMRNPIDFYTQYILGVGEVDEVEETVAYNTLGTVVHESLEQLYKPFIDTVLTETIFDTLKAKAASEVTRQFAEVYSKAALDKGKNLLIFEVAKRYVHNFLNLEHQRVKEGEEIIVTQLEAKNLVSLAIDGIDFPVNLKGTVDRIEAVNGMTRVIDYKTGKVEKSKVKVDNWDAITTDYDKYSKSFQILQYALMRHLQKPITVPIEAGIISFKNLKSGFIPFTYNKETQITSETFDAFSIQLKALIKEICNPEIPFIEKIIPEPFYK